MEVCLKGKENIFPCTFTKTQYLSAGDEIRRLVTESGLPYLTEKAQMLKKKRDLAKKKKTDDKDIISSSQVQPFPYSDLFIHLVLLSHNYVLIYIIDILSGLQLMQQLYMGLLNYKRELYVL